MSPMTADTRIAAIQAAQDYMDTSGACHCETASCEECSVRFLLSELSRHSGIDNLNWPALRNARNDLAAICNAPADAPMPMHVAMALINSAHTAVSVFLADDPGLKEKPARF